jgi:hypothetical protein
MYDGIGGRRGFVVQPPVGEKRVFNWVNEYLIPLAQVATTGVVVGFTVLVSPLIAALSAGRAACWIATGIWMLTNVLWYLWRSMRLVSEDGRPIVEEYGDDVRNTVLPLEIFVGFMIALIIGGITYCFQKVIAMVELPRPFWFTGWIAIVFAVIGFAQFPMFIVMSIFLLTSFGQELVQRSPHQEMFVWKAIGTIIEGLGNRAVQMRRYDHPPTINYRGKTVNDKPATIARRAAQTPEAIEAAALVEFIRRGARLGYARGPWTSGAGIILEATGQKMRVSQWVRFTEGLKRANIMGESGAGNATVLLCSVEEAITHVSHPSFSLE